MKKIILASTSTLYQQSYLEYLKEELTIHFANIQEIVFIPYARPSGISHDEYTTIAKIFFKTIGINVKGIHEFNDPQKALKEAKGIFTGGGNTFVLVNTLYQKKIMTTLKESINNGTPYLGTSAGSNILGLTMQTTNDMPIVYPPSFKTLGIVPFNINAHFIEANPNSSHMGETRETRIKEFHKYNTQPVIGLKEGSWIKITDEKITLEGGIEAILFEQNKNKTHIKSGNDLTNIQ